MKSRYLFTVVLFFLVSCKTHVNNEILVYSNDFESNNLNNIDNGILEQFNGSTVLGRYNNFNNNGYFTLSVNNLPNHSLITVSFDLYIHDSWDGNKTAPDGPDIWQMYVDGAQYINTTFSNAGCAVGDLCSPQSYPANYPNNYNNPKTYADRIDLPGVCHFAGPKGTSLYKITKTFKHTNSSLLLKCIDELVQTNAPDPKCDESWSVDNITIKAISL